ncbi:MAG: leucine-rich repeat protein [Lachnospiraceae bacterium]|nr:leucine-rich repeat protein [Lachnospiraceae bacterium]
MIHAVQGDTGRRIQMIVADETYDSGIVGGLYFRRSDGSYYNVETTFDASDNSFTADMTQLLTQAGKTWCQLKVSSADLQVSTYSFYVIVHKSANGAPEEQMGYTVEDLMSAASEVMGLYTGFSDLIEEVENARIGSDGVAYGSLGDAIREQNISKVSGGHVEDGVAYFTNDNDETLFTITGIGGGGGGGQNDAILTVANTTGWLSTTISESEQCVLSFNWSSVENDYPTGDGQISVRVNGIVKVQQTVRQGEVSINVREYLGSGSNVVRVTFADVYSNTKSISFSVSLVALSVSATAFDQSNASAVYDGPVLFTYVPVGAVTKNMVFMLDNRIIGTQEVTTSGRQQTFTIPAQSHGAHAFECYFTASINGTTVSSNHLYYDLLFVESGETTPIIASPFRAEGATQYYTLSIPYRVYTPGAATSEVSFTATLVDADDQSTTTDLGTRTVDRTQQTFTYTPTKVGTLTLTITTGNVSKNFVLAVARLDIDVEAETDSLELFLSAEGRSNAEARPGTWTFNDISCTFSNFTFVSDGWQLDEDNSTYLKVSGNARLTIPFQIFANDFKGTGKTIEFDFSTTDVMNYDAQIVSCFADNKGLIITPQSVSFRSESSNIMTQYKEDEHVRITFVIEKTVENRLIYTYINGICSGIVQYPAGDDFQQTNPVGITIGSNDCTINLYTIRSYSNSLTRHQVLNNWIADTPNGALMLERYNRNNVYDEYGEIVINKLPQNLPYLIIESATLPQYKGDKKTISGSYVNPIDPTKSYDFTNASIDVQGTSSAGYPRKNYKIKYRNFINEDGESSSVYYLRGAAESLPTNVFCYKADYASSEGANNVELVRLYNDACPYQTEPQEENALVRQGIDGIPILIFWNNPTAGTVSFLGKYNKNFDKDSDVFGMEEGDESWETKDNSNDWALFKRADYEGSDWESAYEARYPEDYNDPTNLSQVAKWINSTDPEQATDATLPESVTYAGTTYTTDSAEYRLAKFRNELTDWFDQTDVLFYYLFTELFLMVDSRVKNSFPTLYASHQGAKWCWLPYDMDTAIGINNEGALAFDYSLEDTDMLSPTAGVYNGYTTVMWNNVRRCFPNELQALYQSVRAEGIISYDEIERRFEEHQNTWNEAIFNEDAYFKYILPFVEDGENNLYMCLGSKAEQRKWWLYNRFRYIDSKYTAGLATSSTLQMRVYQKSDLTVTPYADIYAGALFDSNLVKQRAPRGQATTLQSPAAWNPGGADAVLRIYSADQIKSLGDLSGFYVGAVSFGAASKLQEVKLGDASPLYQNHNLTDVTFGTNKLLTSVDIRNCPNLASLLDFSHCENLKVVHLEGTSVTGVSLADGGMIEEVYLPDTVTNLTLRNLTHLTTLDLNDYSNLTSLWIENTDVVDGLDIVASDMAEGGRVRLVGFDKTFATDAEFTALMRKMMTMRGIDQDGNNLPDAYLEGEVTVGEIARYIYDNLYRWPYLTVHYDTIGAYDYVLHLQNSTAFTEYHDDVITNIRAYAFYGSYVQTVDTPLVTTIGANAFESSRVSTINAPLVTSIGATAFKNSRIASIDFPNLTAVGNNVFEGCTYLTEMNLPNVVSVGTSGFLNARFEHIYMPKLKTLSGGQNFRSSSNNAALKTIVLPALTTNATGQAFRNHTGLTAVDIGPVNGFYANDFNGDSALTVLVLRKTSGVVALNATTVFDGTPFASGGSGGTIYVPQSLIATYQAATNWSTIDGYGTITWAAIEGSIYETQYADGTPIPQEGE